MDNIMGILVYEGSITYTSVALLSASTSTI